MITGSVGRDGLNRVADTREVQKLLNYFLQNYPQLQIAVLDEDGLCGKFTIAAIEAFQRHQLGLTEVSGRVDLASSTLSSLQKQHPELLDPRSLKTRAQVAAAYGAISDDKKWARQNEFLVPYTLAPEIVNDPAYNWINVYAPDKNKVSKIWCHKAMTGFLSRALENLRVRHLLGELKEFGGCLAIRGSRGSDSWSAHSWALAIDLNMTGNGLGETPTLAAEFVKCFTDAGFGWGGYYSRPDGMHFTLAGFDLPRSS